MALSLCVCVLADLSLYAQVLAAHRGFGWFVFHALSSCVCLARAVVSLPVLFW